MLVMMMPQRLMLRWTSAKANERHRLQDIDR
jgi:hypothetical protein